MRLTWLEEAWEQYCDWVQTDRKTARKLNTLIKDIQRNAFTGLGKPEKLKGDQFGWWSRRIDEKNRIVYKIDNDSVIILSCKGHYDDK